MGQYNHKVMHDKREAKGQVREEETQKERNSSFGPPDYKNNMCALVLY